MKSLGRGLSRALLVGSIILFASQLALAGSNRCIVQVSPVVFPPYNPFSAFDAQALGTVTFNCTQSSTIMVLMGAGVGGSVAARYMVCGASRLRYNLFLDPAGQAIWGDGAGGTQFYSNPSPPPNTSVTLYVYARIPARQTGAAAGVYSDRVVVTIMF